MKKLPILLLSAALLFCHSVAIAARVKAEPLPPVPAIAGYIIDGDTFSAKVKLENDASVSVRVRILGIDAPELSGECDKETEWAHRSRNRLVELLPENSEIYLVNVKDDKYLGRIDANVKLSDGRDVGEIMLRENMAIPYSGGKRQPWCD